MRTDHPEDFETGPKGSVDYEQLLENRAESEAYEAEQRAKVKHRCDNCEVVITTEESDGGRIRIVKTEGGNPDAMDTEEWQQGQDFDGLEDMDGLGERLDPGGIVPSGRCPFCYASVYLVDPPTYTADAQLTASQKALLCLVDTVDATGGVVAFENGTHEPVGARDWVDLGDAYIEACKALQRGPKIAEYAKHESSAFDTTDPDAATQCPDCGSKWDAGGPEAGTVCSVCHRGVVEVQR